MSTTAFDVTPEDLQTSANKIENYAAEFTKAYTSIYTAVSDLRVSYQGEASDAFNERIEGYRDDFSAADTTLAEYVAFLRDYASSISSTESELKSQASALSVGN